MLNGIKSALNSNANAYVGNHRFSREKSRAVVGYAGVVPPRGEAGGMVASASRRGVARASPFVRVADTARDTLQWFKSQSAERQSKLKPASPPSAKSKFSRSGINSIASVGPIWCVPRSPIADRSDILNADLRRAAVNCPRSSPHSSSSFACLAAISPYDRCAKRSARFLVAIASPTSTCTWIASLAIVPLYGSIVAKAGEVFFFPFIYGFVAVALAIVGSFASSSQECCRRAVFYFSSCAEPLSCLGLLELPVELFDSGQAKRLFP